LPLRFKLLDDGGDPPAKFGGASGRLLIRGTRAGYSVVARCVQWWSDCDHTVKEKGLQDGQNGRLLPPGKISSRGERRAYFTFHDPAQPDETIEDVFQARRHCPEIGRRAGDNSIGGREIFLGYFRYGFQDAFNALDPQDTSCDGFRQFPGIPCAGIIHDENFHVHLPFFLAGVAKRIQAKDLRVPSASISLITYFHRK
jgi:hypothetical protein